MTDPPATSIPDTAGFGSGPSRKGLLLLICALPFAGYGVYTGYSSFFPTTPAVSDTKQSADMRVVRYFYDALHDGNGTQANIWLAPDVRNKGQFDPAKIAAFYGQLSEPLQLISIEANADRTYLVHYRFKAGSRVCDCRAMVTIRADSAGDSDIQSIRALDGC